MARTASLNSNSRVKSVTISGENKFKRYNIELKGTFYRKVWGGESIHCSIRYEDMIKALNEQIVKLEAKKAEDHALTTIEKHSITLAVVHDDINSLLTLEGWNKYREGVIDAIKIKITKIEEEIKDRDKIRRGNSVYTNMDEPWKNIMFKIGDNYIILCPADHNIRGMVGHQVTDVATSKCNVIEWKEKELARLLVVQAKIKENIDLLHSINENDAQKWYEELRSDAIAYIETGKNS